MREGFRVFVSHSHVDVDVAKRIAKALAEMDIRCTWKVPWGQDLTEGIKDAISRSTHLIAVISQATPESDWVRAEIGIAAGKGIPVLPYLTHRSLAPAVFEAFPLIKGSCWVSGLKEIRHHFADLLRGSQDSLCRGPEFELPRQPYREFCGRGGAVNQICREFQDAHGAPVITIHGMGGIGKTALAHEVAHRSLRSGDFDDAIWLQASRPIHRIDCAQAPSIPMTVESILNKIAQRLGVFNLLDMPDGVQIDVLAPLLRKRRTLLVLDNMETSYEPQEEIVSQLQKLLAVTPTRLLLTSRHRFKYQYGIPLQGLDLEGSRQFLRQLGDSLEVTNLRRASNVELARISDSVGGSPLAMKLVAGHLRYAQIPQVLERVCTVKLHEEWSSEDDYELFYNVLFWWSWKLLRDDARELLLSLAWYDPFEGVSQSRFLASSGMEETAFLNAVDQLWTLSFLEVYEAQENSSDSHYCLHPLTRHFAEEFAETDC